MGDNYISFYNGGYSSLNPEGGNYVGYRLNAGKLSSTTSPMVANQLNETISRIKEGVKNVEIQLVSPDVAETIPKQQFQEIHALTKLTGVKPSLHAPVIDPAGFTQQGYGGDNLREDAERRFLDSIEKAHQLDPKENVTVVFHASNAGIGPEFRPGDTKKGEDRFKMVGDVIINRETGQINPIKEKISYYPNSNELKPEKDLSQQGKIFTTDQAIASANQNEWDNRIREAATLQKEVEENLLKVKKLGGFNLAKKEKISEQRASEMGNYLSRSDIFLRDADLSFRGLFDKAYEHGTEEQRKKLKKLASSWEEREKELFPKGREVDQVQEMDIQNRLLSQRLTDLRKEFEPKKRGENGEIIYNLPKIYTRAEDFAKEKAAQTFGNVAWKSYEKYKDHSPIVAIENLFPGLGISRAEDLKALVQESRENFVKNAVKEGMSKSEAKKTAERLIGATWDVGHLNIHKGRGFTDKDLKKQTKEIAPFVKHIHLTDNFGHSDSHLAPGMGNVPIKAILEELEKNKDYEKMAQVIEAGGLVNPNMGLRMSPFRETLGAFGSQVTSGSSPAYWNQAEQIQGNYFAFPMAYMPEKHFSLYGSGFSTLPEELGGQVPGSGSRFSGTPNA